MLIFAELIKPIDFGSFCETYCIFEEGPLKYGIFNIWDGRKDTCYVVDPRGAKGGGIYIAFSKRIVVDEVHILAGNQENDRTFKEYGRPSVITIGLFETKKELYAKATKDREVIWLKDTMEEQVHKFSKERAGFIVDIGVGVYNAYPGTRIKYPAISEIEFYYKGKKVGLGPIEELKKSYVEAFVKEVRKWIVPEPTEKIPRKWYQVIEFKDWVSKKPVRSKDVLFKPDGGLEWRIYDRAVGWEDYEKVFKPEIYTWLMDYLKVMDYRWPRSEREFVKALGRAGVVITEYVDAETGEYHNLVEEASGEKICRVVEEGRGAWKFDGEGRLWIRLGKEWEHVDYILAPFSEELIKKWGSWFVVKNTKLKGAYGAKWNKYEEEW